MSKTNGTAGSWIKIVGYTPPKLNATLIVHGEVKKNQAPQIDDSAYFEEYD